MKGLNWMMLTGINLLLIIVIILPFLPGPPNKLVIGLSAVAQSAGFFGQLLLPVGITWTILEIRKLRKRNNESANWKAAYYLAITATAILTAIGLVFVVEVILHFKILVGLSGLILGAFILNRAIKKIKKLRHSSDGKLNPVPIYLLTIPLVALLTNNFLVRPLSEYSRSFAIKRSEALIASIEDYKNKEGKYPESIQDLEARYLKKLPGPFIMGILNFRYNKINDHYSISFSQWLELGSLEEIVLYDKNNLKNNFKGMFAGYDYNIDLCRVNGAFASHDTRHDYWRYYLCD